ncbi:MAG TPA: branched-chain amino acid transaminase [Xanthobacteraceae bacterium]|nr:branched-chain amino acid transaminase [Xanthobacteraceae bacterium]
MSDQVPEFIVQNGDFVPYESATVHVMSPAVKYGLSVFEGLRAYKSEADGTVYAFRLQEHTERLFQSMRLLRFEPAFTPEEINEKTVELLRRVGVQSAAHIRTTAFIDGKGEQQARKPIGYSISVLEKARKPNTSKGIRCQVSAWTRIDDTSMPPRIKCGGNYVNGRLARFQAIQDGYDEAIQLNTAGKVAEAPGACLFAVRRGVVSTPDVASGILEGITRDSVMEIAASNGWKVQERQIEKTELYASDEVFLTGSALELVPVVDIDGIKIGTGQRGPITEKLQQGYFEAVCGPYGRERGWLTPVPGK